MINMVGNFPAKTSSAIFVPTHSATPTRHPALYPCHDRNTRLPQANASLALGIHVTVKDCNER